MGTRSVLAITHEDVKSTQKALQNYFQEDNSLFDTITISYDSYPENVYKYMKELMQKYDVKVLMRNGNIRSLASNYEPNELGFHNENSIQNNVTFVYARDLEKCDDRSFYEMKTLKSREIKDNYKFYDYMYVVTPEKEIFWCDDFNTCEFNKGVKKNDD